MKALVSYAGIYRKESFFFPKMAFRELLLNAVIRKDYFSTTPIQIRVYKDRIRLWNDGRLPAEIPVERLFQEHVSKPSNPNLANVFFKCGMVESWGRGFEKIISYYKENESKLPEIDHSLGGVTARCFASDGYLKLEREHAKDPFYNGKKVNDPINGFCDIVLAVLKEYPEATYNEIAMKSGKSTATVKRVLAKLKADGKIVREGSKKTGRWMLL